MEEVSLSSEAGMTLKDIILESYLDAQFDSKWLPAKIQLIHNKTIQTAYDGLYMYQLFDSVLLPREAAMLARSWGS